MCRVFDLVIEDGHEMVSMEFVDGTTLAELVAKRSVGSRSRAGGSPRSFLQGWRLSTLSDWFIAT